MHTKEKWYVVHPTFAIRKDHKLEQECDARNLHKTFFTVAMCKFGYATKDEDRWIQVSRGIPI